MPVSAQIVFVLWAKQFEEEATTIFTTELRQAGIRTKIIGLDGDQSPGRYGVTLLPDLSLHEALALADCAICVVIPAGPWRMRRVQADPRFGELLARVADHALILLGCDTEFQLCDPEPFERVDEPSLLPSTFGFAHYPANEDLVLYVRQLAQVLQGTGGA